MEINKISKEKQKNIISKVLEVLKTMASRPSGFIGLCILVFHIILAFLSPYLAPYDYKAIDPTLMLQAPSSEYWFGTDSLGRDVFTRTIMGGRTALTITFFGSLIALLWGGLLGIFCGLVGGKIDDVVIVEGEWGWIEKIMLTYVVVKIWDKRRLIVPTTYFIEKPFQNWTKSSADILGTVFLYTDYKVPIDALRKELTRVLNNTDLWDGEVNVLQVTDSKANYVETRALMSAKNSPTAWDLRVHVREKLILFLQENYPESLARTRVSFESSLAVEQLNSKD